MVSTLFVLVSVVLSHSSSKLKVPTREVTSLTRRFPSRYRRKTCFGGILRPKQHEYRYVSYLGKAGATEQFAHGDAHGHDFTAARPHQGFARVLPEPLKLVTVYC
jgi:hypothetical protein